jgi:hypothetical protein
MSGPFKMKGTPMQRNFGIGASPVKNNGKSKTKGPVTSDTRVSTSDGTSIKIGPELSPEAIEKEKQEYLAQKKKTGEFSKETLKELKEFEEADAYRKT